jgi:hypothetical protein
MYEHFIYRLILPFKIRALNYKWRTRVNTFITKFGGPGHKELLRGFGTSANVKHIEQRLKKRNIAS